MNKNFKIKYRQHPYQKWIVLSENYGEHSEYLMDKLAYDFENCSFIYQNETTGEIIKEIKRRGLCSNCDLCRQTQEEKK